VFRSLLPAIILLLMFVTGCKEAPYSRQPVSQPDSQLLLDRVSSEDSYIFINALGNIEFFNAFKYSWAQAGAAYGVNTRYLGPSELNIPAMLETFNQAVAANPKGIAVWGVDPALIPAINAASEQGIPVVTVIGDLPNSERISYIGSSQFELGYAAGRGYLDYVGNQGEVAILSLPGVAMFDEREHGAKAALKQATELNVIAVADTRADSITAVTVATELLETHPDLTGFIGLDSTSAMGAAVAVEAAGKQDSVQIIGMDRNSDVLEKIRSGVIAASVAQGDVMMAFWALQTLINHNYYTPQLTADNQIAGAKTSPAKIIVPSNMVDTKNVDLYLQANKKYADY